MGDNGRIYATYTEEMCGEMRRLIEYADIITPNLTECCRLTDTVYKEEGWEEEELYGMAGRLLGQGPEKVVITGISGTGDVFASIIAADAINGVGFEDSVRKASDFVREGILKSVELDIPSTDGVCFEEILYTLKRD